MARGEAPEGSFAAAGTCGPDNIDRLFEGTADRQTSITVSTKPVMQGARSFVVPVTGEPRA